MIKKDSLIVDLGGGSGKYTNYFIKKGFKAICYDFSKEMIDNALKFYPDIPYILDDIVNVREHFDDKTVDGIIAMYSLFHIPNEELKNTIYSIESILKDGGIFCLSFQLGNGEKYVDEPYLKENGKNVLYVNYLNKEDIYNLLSGFDILYEYKKKELGDNVLGEEGNDAIYIICKKK